MGSTQLGFQGINKESIVSTAGVPPAAIHSASFQWRIWSFQPADEHWEQPAQDAGPELGSKCILMAQAVISQNTLLAFDNL